MAFIDGYLGIHIDGSSPIVAGTVLSLESSGLILQCAIAVVGCRHMANHKGVNMLIKPHGQLFILSSVCSCTSTLCLMMFTAMRMLSYSDTMTWTMVLTVFFLATYYFTACLLAILVLRLHIVFGQTTYQMSKSTQRQGHCTLRLVL